MSSGGHRSRSGRPPKPGARRSFKLKDELWDNLGKAAAILEEDSLGTGNERAVSRADVVRALLGCFDVEELVEFLRGALVLGPR